MEKSSTIAYFGYGSLVNLKTLQTPYISAHRARLTGWRRTWLSRPKVAGSFAPVDGLAFLSAEQSIETTIDGLVIIDHRSSLKSIDERESLYDRVSIDRTSIAFPDGDPLEPGADLFLYVAQEPQAGRQASILRSYLDVVLQGYLGHFGESGIAQFVETTGNFDCPVREDRDAPLYPRPVTLAPNEARLFETHLQKAIE